MKSSMIQQIMKIAKDKGIMRPKDLDSYGLHRKYLTRMHNQGYLKRVGRGLYVPSDFAPSENRSLAEACKKVPDGVICLLSALQFHSLTTQMPFEVWLAIDRKAWRPKVVDMPIRIVCFSGLALKEGIKKHTVHGVEVNIYNPAKTVVDCFKYRNKIGLDVAIEALRDCRRQRKATNDQLWHYAKICRVANVMKPYLEATL